MRRRFAIVVVLAAIGWFLLSLWQPFGSEGEGRVAVTVPRGADLGDIADQLHDAGIVDSAFFFKLRARLSGTTSDFKAGRHLLKRDMSYAAAIRALQASARSGLITVTIPEGRSRHEVAELVASVGVSGDYEQSTARSSLPKRYGGKSNSSLEGFLFPATYEVPPNATVKRLVTQQVKAFRQNIAAVDMSYARKKNLTRFDVLIIASLVEREVSVPSERRLVAAVIYNRLKQGIGLGIDATTRFAVRNWERPLTQTQLNSGSPYNTRRRLGLPPGPIGSPGLASLKAAARPARVGYLFYVADPCKPGYHRFSKTDAEFQRDVAAYNKAREKAGGKAPEGC